VKLAPPIADWPPSNPAEPLAVLVSGGLDSAVLLGEAVRFYPAVYPLYIRVGSYWESVEYEYLLRFLNAIATPTLKPLTVLNQPVADLYGAHWSLTGRDVPAVGMPDEACFLPGRNVLLFAKPLLWCTMHGIPALATAPLGSNAFPDATPEFYDGFAEAVNRSVGGRVRVLRPYADLGLNKADVLRRGVGLPLEHTFSCIRPEHGLHCGRCAKCGERQDGFADAGMVDPTGYAAKP